MAVGRVQKYAAATAELAFIAMEKITICWIGKIHHQVWSISLFDMLVYMGVIFNR